MQTEGITSHISSKRTHRKPEKNIHKTTAALSTNYDQVHIFYFSQSKIAIFQAQVIFLLYSRLRPVSLRRWYCFIPTLKLLTLIISHFYGLVFFLAILKLNYNIKSTKILICDLFLCFKIDRRTRVASQFVRMHS